MINNEKSNALYELIGNNLDAFYFIFNTISNTLKYVPMVRPVTTKAKKTKSKPIESIKNSIEESENLQKLRTIFNNVPLTPENYEVKLAQIAQDMSHISGRESIETEIAGLKPNSDKNHLIESQYNVLTTLNEINKMLENKAESIGKPTDENGYIPFNKQIEKLAIEGEFKKAIELVKAKNVFKSLFSSFSSKKVTVIIIRSVVLNKKTGLYRKLYTEFPDFKQFITATILQNEGKEKAIEYVNASNLDLNDKADLLKYLNTDKNSECPLSISTPGKDIGKNILLDK